MYIDFMSARPSSPGTAPPGTGTPLRQNLLIRVGMLVSGAVLLVGMVFFQFGMEPLVRRIAEARFAEAAIRVSYTPAEFSQFIRDEMTRLRDLVTRANIKFES